MLMLMLELHNKSLLVIKTAFHHQKKIEFQFYFEKSLYFFLLCYKQGTISSPLNIFGKDN